MSDITNSAINYHTFNARPEEALMDQVSKIICVLFPRGLMVAGFDKKGAVLMIRYGDYHKSLPAWIPDFYEHRFTDEPLLSDPRLVTATYLASDKYLIVPGDLYEESESLNWMNAVFFVEGNETVLDHRLVQDNAHYLYTIPGTIKSVIARFFTHSKLLPLPGFQFSRPEKPANTLHCLIMPENCFATLFKNNRLQWHQVFSYEKGEDIAYQLKLACSQSDLNEEGLSLKYTTAYRGLNPVWNNLKQYFPESVFPEEASETEEEWNATLQLLQQLYTCAL